MIRRLWHRTRDWTRDSAAYLGERPLHAAVVVASLAAGFGVGTPVGDAAYDYTWRDPRFCGDCHVHDYADENYFLSVHAGVTTCHDCHKVPLLHYPIEMWMMVADRPEYPEDVGPVHVPSVLCGACHLEGSHEELTGPMTPAFREQVVKVDDSPLHRIHLQSTTRDPGTYLGAGHPGDGSADADPHAGGHGGEHGDDVPHGLEDEERTIYCLDCHGSGGDLSAHRFTPTRENCVACHAGVDVAVGRLEGLSCQECHLTGFVGKRPEPQGAAH